MSTSSAAGARASSGAWFLRRELPLALLVVGVVVVLLAGDATLLRLVGVLQVLGVAGVLLVWQRQGLALRRERAAAERLRTMSAAVTAVERDVRQARSSVERDRDERRQREQALDRAQEKKATRERFERRHDFAQVEAAMNLYTLYPPSARMPALRGWAMSPDLLLVVLELVRQRRPRLVVELGAGSSTLWLAHVAERLGLDTRVVTLEHDAGWADKVQRVLDEQGVGSRSQVRLAPLTEQPVGEGTGSWYAPSGWQDLADVDLLLVDGPPAGDDPEARMPAVPLLAQRLSAQAVVVMDDAGRPGEQRVADAWEALLPDFARLDLPVEKRATIFYRGGPPAL
ncbi:hypothetical protein GCM10027446_28170 [Angustibacter peucedani]